MDEAAARRALRANILEAVELSPLVSSIRALEISLGKTQGSINKWWSDVDPRPIHEADILAVSSVLDVSPETLLRGADGLVTVTVGRTRDDEAFSSVLQALDEQNTIKDLQIVELQAKLARAHAEREEQQRTNSLLRSQQDRAMRDLAAYREQVAGELAELRELVTGLRRSNATLSEVSRRRHKRALQLQADNQRLREQLGTGLFGEGLEGDAEDDDLDETAADWEAEEFN